MSQGWSWVVGVLVVLMAAPPAAAQRPPTEDGARQNLRQMEQELQQARDRRLQLERDRAGVRAELAVLRDRLVAAGRTTADSERTVSELEAALQRTEADRDRRQAELQRRQSDLTALAIAAQRLAAQPPDAMFALPQAPVDTVRTALLLRSALPQIDARMATLRRDLAELAQSEETIRAQRDLVRAAASRLVGERRQLDQLIRQRQALEQRLEEESGTEERRVARLAAGTRDLRDLVDRLAAERQAEERRRQEQQRRQEEARRLEQERQRDELTQGRGMPAAGRIVAGFGVATEGGQNTRGLTLETRDGATVLAPAPGTVVFADTYRGYGLMLILEHRGGYHSILSGLARLDVGVGKALRTGEPIGVMGRSADRTTSLYFEVRRSGQPVNPQPWLADRAR
ncbi:MAG: peptidoglycan DD-metalloendopeptidase family protein [Alphaproteobacteria bacterium]|nr:peptidoglycan DD-metalloendopeptidase family protein [Alphaproteobacteria bacterium]